MATKLNELRAAASAHAKTAREVAEKAGTEGRSMTDAEKSVYEEAMAKGRALLPMIETARADESVLSEAKALAEAIGPDALADLDVQGKSGGDVGRRLKNLGFEVVNSPEFKSALEAAMGGKSQIPQGTHFQTSPIGLKSLFVGGSGTSAGAFVTPDRTDIVESLGRKPLTIRDLVSKRRTTSDSVQYVVQTSHTNNAAPVAEATSSAAPTTGASAGAALTLATGGGYKPEGAWAFEVKTTAVKTIAEWVPATKRALADVAQLEGLINDELERDVKEAEENQIVNGNGTGENFTGIMNVSGTQAQAWDTDLFTTTRKALTKARVVGRVNPTAWVFNPADEERIDLLKDGDERFYGAGPFSLGPQSLWGIPRFSSETVPAGSGILADWSKAVIWDREDTTVTMTDSHADFFIRNLIAILAEERLAFGVTRPSAFVIADLTA